MPLFFRGNFYLSTEVFDEDLRVQQDLMLYIRMAAAGLRFRYIDSVLATHRKRIGSTIDGLGVERYWDAKREIIQQTMAIASEKDREEAFKFAVGLTRVLCLMKDGMPF